MKTLSVTVSPDAFTAAACSAFDVPFEWCIVFYVL